MIVARFGLWLKFDVREGVEMAEDAGSGSPALGGLIDSCDALTEGTSVRLDTRCNSDLAMADFERLWLNQVLAK